jgi:hypothetical protein
MMTPWLVRVENVIACRGRIVSHIFAFVAVSSLKCNTVFQVKCHLQNPLEHRG